jgi:hypothetical protein
MESPADLLRHHKKTLHYDASEEDNDPLIDDGGSAIALPVSLRANRARTRLSHLPGPGINSH